MQIGLSQIDAFTNHCFGGNPAAVCLLERWIPDTTMQAIATAYVILNVLEPARSSVRFHARSAGVITVTRLGDKLRMDFPARPPGPRPGLGDVAAALGALPLEVLAASE